MAATRRDEFKRDAVRIALTSGLTRRQVASDLGIVPAQDTQLDRENERLRKENRILRE